MPAPATPKPAAAASHSSSGAPASVVKMLTLIVADTYSLMIKTHGAHWNARGSGFFEIHAAFEAQYQALLLAADELAERVRALGQDAPASITQLAVLSSIAEVGQSDCHSLVRALRDDHRFIARRCHDAISAAQAAGDEATADLLIRRVEEHDKTAWMLSATLGT